MKSISNLIFLVILTQSIYAQDNIKKIELKKGFDTLSLYDDLNIVTFFQVYDEQSANHLVGDLYLRINHQDQTITEFYIDKSTKEYYTKVYENYFLSFLSQKDKHYLIIENTRLGKNFALSSKENVTLFNNNDTITLEITDFTHEWGYDAPPEDENRKYFSNVNYTLKVSTRNEVKHFSFLSSEIKSDLVFEIGSYNIQIRSDIYKDCSCLIEMKVTKKSQ